MPQTTSPTAMTYAIEGALYQESPDPLIDSGVNEEGSNAIAFGTFVARGTTERGVIQPAGATDAAKLCGIALHSHAYAKAYDGTTATGDLSSTGILPKGKVNVLRRGRVWMKAEQDLARGDRSLRVRHTAGAGGSTIGALRKDAVAGETINLSGAAEVIVGAAAGSFVVVELDMENGIGSVDT